MLMGVVMMISVSIVHAEDEQEPTPPGCCLDIWDNEGEPHAYWWREKDGYKIKYSLEGNVIEFEPLTTDDIVEYYILDRDREKLDI